MAVNPNSVISTRIQNFDDALYVAITDKEDYQYTSGSNGRLTEYQPLFQNLNDAILTYFDINRESDVRTFINGLYGYKALADMFGTDNSLLSSSDSSTVQDINGFRSRIKTDTLSYYDDYPQVTFSGSIITRDQGSWIDDGFTENMSITVSGTVSNDGTYTVAVGGVTATDLTLVETVSNEGPIGFVTITGTGTVRMGSANIAADIALIDVAWTNQEQPDMENLVSGYLSVIGVHGFDSLFIDKTPLTVLSKDDMNTYIFDTLGYRGPFSELNIGNLTIPPPPSP